MPLDLAPDLCKALQDPAVASALAQQLKPIVLQALAEREHDGLLSPKKAAHFVYGEDGKEQAFAKMRARHPEIDAVSIGVGKRRRWRRSELAEVWGRLHPGFLKS
jgi:hypothetical protein